MPDDDQPPPDDDDKFRPDAIAARIDKLGTESDTDRVAREEEQKLFERKKVRKKGGGLESAASKRLAKIGEGKVKRPSAASAVAADPVLDRVASLQKWLRQNQTVAIGVVAVAVLATGAGVSVAAWHERQDAQASVLLAQAMAAERGSIASAKDDADDDTPSKALYPTFKSAADRRDTALTKYRAVEAKYGGTGSAILARLAEGGILLDIGDAASAKAAATAYEDVRTSALAAADSEVRGRAIEGKGFASELLATADAPNRDKHLDDALTEFKALEAVDGFKDLGTYHEARLAAEKGDQCEGDRAPEGPAEARVRRGEWGERDEREGRDLVSAARRRGPAARPGSRPRCRPRRRAASEAEGPTGSRAWEVSAASVGAADRATST